MFKSFRTRNTMIKGALPANLFGGRRWWQTGSLRAPSRLGDELVINGDFATDTDWTKGTGWTINGAAHAAPGAISALTSIAPVALNQGASYLVVVWVGAAEAGAVGANIGTTLGLLHTTVGRHQEIIVAGAGSFVALDKNAAFDGNVEQFSVKEIIF